MIREPRLSDPVVPHVLLLFVELTHVGFNSNTGVQ